MGTLRWKYGDVIEANGDVVMVVGLPEVGVVFTTPYASAWCVFLSPAPSSGWAPVERVPGKFTRFNPDFDQWRLVDEA